MHTLNIQIIRDQSNTHTPSLTNSRVASLPRVVDLIPLSIKPLNMYTGGISFPSETERMKGTRSRRTNVFSILQKRSWLLHCLLDAEVQKRTEENVAKRKQRCREKSAHRASRGFIAFHLQFRAILARGAARKSSCKKYKAD